MNKEENNKSSSSSNSNVDKIKTGATNLAWSHHQNYNTVVSWDDLHEQLTNNTVNPANRRISQIKLKANFLN